MELVIATSHSPTELLITSVGVFEQGLCVSPSWKTPVKLNICGLHNKGSYGWDRDCLKPPGLGLYKDPFDSQPLFEKAAYPFCRQHGAQQRRDQWMCLLSEVARGEEGFLLRTAGKKGHVCVCVGGYLLFGFHLQSTRDIGKSAERAT